MALNRQQRRAMKSKKKQGMRVSHNVKGRSPKFSAWQALDNISAVNFNKNMEEE